MELPQSDGSIRVTKESPDKNVIFVIIDCLRSRNLGCYGNSSGVSPNIDDKAEQGVIFDEAYCATNHTDPAFTTITSGKYPLSHGILHHGLHVTEEEIETLNQTNTTFLPELLKPLGYHNIAVSGLRRWHERGYDWYGVTLEEAEDRSGIYEMDVVERIKEPIRKNRNRIPKPIFELLQTVGQATGAVRTKANAKQITDIAIKHIKNRPQENFFTLLHYNDAHYPYDIPNEFFPEYDEEEFETPIEDVIEQLPDDDEVMGGSWKRRAKNINLDGIEYWEELPIFYEAGIRYTDNELGRLFDFLNEAGLSDDTVLVITGDHGDNVHDTNVFSGHHGLYDGTIKVPLIIVDDDLPAGERVDSFVQHVDLVPTVLDLLDMNVTACERSCDGKSLVPVIEDGDEIRSSVFVMDAVTDDRFAIKDDRYKYICSLSGDEPVHGEALNSAVEELHLVDKEPARSKNLVDEWPDVAEEYNKRLRDWKDRLEEGTNRRKEAIGQLVNGGLFGIDDGNSEAQSDEVDEKLIEFISAGSSVPAYLLEFALYNTLFVSMSDELKEGSYEEEDVKERLKNLGYIE